MLQVLLPHAVELATGNMDRCRARCFSWCCVWLLPRGAHLLHSHMAA